MAPTWEAILLAIAEESIAALSGIRCNAVQFVQELVKTSPLLVFAVNKYRVSESRHSFGAWKMDNYTLNPGVGG